MLFTPPILVPLAAALLYAIAALLLKRATQRGIGPWRVMFVTNWIEALLFAPFWLLGGAPFLWVNLLHAVLCGAAFFAGQVFTFLALSRGDVSVATPVLGTKVIFVALFAVLLGSEHLTAGLWFAALLTAIATALLGTGGPRPQHSIGVSLFYGFSAAASFALTDVLAQKWAAAWGFGHFAPAMFATVALLSFGLIPFFRGKMRDLPWPWLGSGAVLLGLQASGIAYAVMSFGSATTTNVVYNSRGIWTVLLVWTVGGWFANTERAQGHRIMLRRLFASLLLLAAIALVAHSH